MSSYKNDKEVPRKQSICQKAVQKRQTKILLANLTHDDMHFRFSFIFSATINYIVF